MLFLRVCASKAMRFKVISLLFCKSISLFSSASALVCSIPVDKPIIIPWRLAWISSLDNVYFTSSCKNVSSSAIFSFIFSH